MPRCDETDCRSPIRSSLRNGSRRGVERTARKAACAQFILQPAGQQLSVAGCNVQQFPAAGILAPVG